MADADYPASWYAATRDCQSPSVRRWPAPRQPTSWSSAAALPACTRRAFWRCAAFAWSWSNAGAVAWGASGRNGGFVGAGYAERSGALIDRLGLDHARRLYAQSQRGVAIVGDAIDAMARPGIRMGSGKLTVSRTDQGGHFADRTRALAGQLGASFEPWATAEVRAVLATERYHQAIHDPTSFHIHPLNFALALAADIERRGGAIYEATEAIGLERHGGWRLRTSGGAVTARHVVLAGNADLGPLQPRVARAVLPVATYVAVTAKLGPGLAGAVGWSGAISDTRRAGDYYRVVDGDRLLWGGRITTDTREPPRLRDMMRRDILSVYPQLGDVRIDYAWPGIMGYAPHRMPQVGEIEAGLWICSAFGGHGLAQTAAGADAVAAGIAGEDDRWKLFRPFGMGWAGGPVGRIATQFVYWKLQASDWWDEKRQAKNAETLRT